MARDYEKNPASHLHMKYPDPLEYCRTLVRIYGDETKQYTSLAEYQRRSPKTQGSSATVAGTRGAAIPRGTAAMFPSRCCCQISCDADHSDV
jgi:hypothetical protein